VVGDDDAQALFPEPEHDLLKLDDRQGVDAGERLVEKKELGPEGERPADLELPPLAAAQAVGGLPGQRQQAELVQEFVRDPLPLRAAVWKELQDELQVLPDSGLEEDRVLLGKIGDPQAGPVRCRARGNVPAVEVDPAVLGSDQADDHLESRRLAGPVSSQEPDDFAGLDTDIDAGDDQAPAVAFGEFLGAEHGH